MVGEETAAGIDIGVVADIRKPEQVQAVHDLGGKVIRLLRDPYEGADRHISETALDNGMYDQRNFDLVLDNRSLTLAETHIAICRALRSWGIVMPWCDDETVKALRS
jgi:hypothetical protein